MRFPESCDDSDCEPLVALACFILDTIWYSFLFLIRCWVCNRRTYLSFAFSSFCFDHFLFLTSIVSVLYMLEAATSACSSHLLELMLWWSGIVDIDVPCV